MNQQVYTSLTYLEHIPNYGPFNYLLLTGIPDKSIIQIPTAITIFNAYANFSN